MDVLSQPVDDQIDVDEIAEIVATRSGWGRGSRAASKETRATLRHCMYEIVDMLPPDADEAFLADLAA